MSKYTTVTDPDYSLLDNHTGEILKWKKTKVVSIDEFMLFFFASMPQIFRLEGQQMKTLMCCWKYSSYNNVETEGNLVYNNKLFKDYVRSCGLDVSDGAIDLMMYNLAKEGMLIKRCRGVYMLNPKYFFKGTLSKRSKLELKVVTNCNKEGEKEEEEEE